MLFDLKLHNNQNSDDIIVYKLEYRSEQLFIIKCLLINCHVEKIF